MGNMIIKKEFLLWWKSRRSIILLIQTHIQYFFDEKFQRILAKFIICQNAASSKLLLIEDIDEEKKAETVKNCPIEERHISFIFFPLNSKVL